jgi:tetratricopeptide (TPR) repeat protein
MRIIGWMLAGALLLTGAAAAGQAVQNPDASDRGKTIERWAAANRPALTAAVKPADPETTARQLRAAAGAGLGTLSDGEVGDLLISGADSYINDGDNPKSLMLGEAALGWARAKLADPGYQFDALVRTGSARYYMSDYAGAARDMAESVERARAITPFDANAVANAGANYAVILDNAGRYREAEAEFHKAIALRRDAKPFRPNGLATAYSGLAAVEKRQGRFDLAEGHYRLGLETMEKGELTATLSYMRLLHNYAVFVGQQGRDEEAVRLYRRALEITPPEKRLLPNMIPDHTSLAQALTTLGRLDEADAVMAQAMTIVAALPKPTIDVAVAYSNRSGIRERRGDLAGAEADLRRALAVSRAVRGGDRNIDVPGDLIALASLLRKAGKTEEAEKLTAEAIAAYDVIPEANPLRAVILDERAASLAATGRSGEALAASRGASELLVATFDLERARDPGPVPVEQRPILGRRVALVWDAAQR